MAYLPCARKGAQHLAVTQGSFADRYYRGDLTVGTIANRHAEIGRGREPPEPVRHRNDRPGQACRGDAVPDIARIDVKGRDYIRRAAMAGRDKVVNAGAPPFAYFAGITGTYPGTT